jgi:hypothetical protein
MYLGVFSVLPLQLLISRATSCWFCIIEVRQISLKGRQTELDQRISLKLQVARECKRCTGRGLCTAALVNGTRSTHVTCAPKVSRCEARTCTFHEKQKRTACIDVRK